MDCSVLVTSEYCWHYASLPAAWAPLVLLALLAMLQLLVLLLLVLLLLLLTHTRLGSWHASDEA